MTYWSLTCIAFAVVECSYLSIAGVLTVPTEYPTVQVALDFCSEGDTVLILRGRYDESIAIPDVSVLLAGECHTLLLGARNGAQ